jgi:hypothetical protein
MTTVGKGNVEGLTRHLLSMRVCNIAVYGHCLGQIRRMSHGEDCGPGDFRGERSVREVSYPGYSDNDFKEVLRRLGEDNLPLL